ncbi:hypothetical protein [Paraliomyxa miuraensis]|uniref:hypothetical protein n=1 Tax=Paraliomyxa miuraensis TaxID=376150 RepID=UPI0022536112|nr:hypothetical protein [Paraliomyxa miuraensis]MCX4242435.1 hypothetical protein [Paraliomyxa miuraensis]
MLATAARVALVTLVLGPLLACSGESKPAATSPTPEAKSDAKPEGAPVANADGGDKVKVVEGQPPGKDDRYALQIEPPAEATAGQEAEVVVRVIPKDPWHMNLDFPTSLKLTPPDGLVLANANLKKGDARKLDEGSCEFSVKVTPSAAGEHTVAGQLKFAVCQDEACSPVTEDVELKLAAK